MNEDRRQSREPQPTHADYARADALRVRPCSHGYRSSGSCRECKAEAFAACRAEYEAKLAAYESQARAQGDTILDLNAKLADEVRLADALLRELNRRQDASFSLTTDDVIANYEAARRAGNAVAREEGKR